jgi:hypothetical protein
VECLHSGYRHSDESPASQATYRDSIAEVGRVIASLSAGRQRLGRKLDEGAARTFDD